MAKIQVLLDEAGNVLGTAQQPSASEGEAAPEGVGLVAGAGQQLAEVEVADELLEGSAADLYAHLKQNFLG